MQIVITQCMWNHPKSKDPQLHKSWKHTMHGMHIGSLQGISSGGSHLILACHGVHSCIFQPLAPPLQ
jgi:hypothetical protein